MGWAVRRVDRRALHGTIDLATGIKRPADHHPLILRRAHEEIARLISLHGIGVVVIEEGCRRGRSSQILHKLIGVAQVTAALRNLGCLSARAVTARKLVLGNGAAKKPDVVPRPRPCARDRR
jgi:Holliday junction resolvasome RuvABC endonuclease subunit